MGASGGSYATLVIVAERLRRFASSIWTLIAYRIDGNAATALLGGSGRKG